jgi:hypothetical protein
MFDKLREQIAAERKNRLADMSALQNEISEREAELRIGAVELEELDYESE